MIKATFEYQSDNMAMAIEEIKLQLKEFDLALDKIVCVSKKKADVPEDWFKDYLFTFDAYILSEDDLDDSCNDSIEEEALCKRLENELPDCTEAKRASLIEFALMAISREDTAYYMAGLLLDEKISSYKMFEELASSYLRNKNEEYRKGIDMACAVLTGWSLETIARNLIENYEVEEVVS